MAQPGTQVNPVQVQKYLSGVDYPATKYDLIEAAEDEDAPDDVLDMLNQLPEDKEFNGPDDVSEAIGSLE